jgi:lysophospholipase L1-like esterase
MKENFKILSCVVIVFIGSFFVLSLFLDAYSEGLLTTEKNIVSVGGIVHQNPKQITLDVLKTLSGEDEEKIKVNSFGFRGEEFNEIKPDNTFRIVLLGGSQMFGTGATSEQTTIPGYLREMINLNKLDYDIEIINAGVKGIDSYKELLLLENTIINFSPDMIIVYDGLNDLRSVNSATHVLENWNSICNSSIKNNIDALIILQPLAGFGSKLLTENEKQYSENGIDFNNEPLINSLYLYEDYSKKLQKLENCKNGIDMRFIFDDQIEQIYIDEGHVSDRGNQIVANSIFPYIESSFPSEIISGNMIINKSEGKKLSMMSEIEYAIDRLIKNYGEKLISISVPAYEEDVKEVDSNKQKNIVKSQSMNYENEEISIEIELIQGIDQVSNQTILKMNVINEITGEKFKNVTYFLDISFEGGNILRDFFFVENENFEIRIMPNASEKVIIKGDRQYDHNAIIVNEENPIIVSGPVFTNEGIYEFRINLRTIDDPSNWMFSLDGFRAEVLIEKVV